MMSAMSQMAGANISEPEVLAEVIWNAVTDGTTTLRYTAGDDAAQYMANRKALDDEAFIGGVKAQMGLWARQINAGREFRPAKTVVAQETMPINHLTLFQLAALKAFNRALAETAAGGIPDVDALLRARRGT